MAFDLARGVMSGRNWARSAEGVSVAGVELTPPESGMKKMLAAGAVAGVAVVGGWMFLSSRKPVARRNETMIMTKSPSGRIYAGPLAGYYGKR